MLVFASWCPVLEETILLMLKVTFKWLHPWCNVIPCSSTIYILPNVLSLVCCLQSLAEKGGSDLEKIVAHDKFLLLATMNPGGDFGKKELSPALRNRFTEIWVPPVCDINELRSIALRRYVILDYYFWRSVRMILTLFFFLFL